MMCLALRVEGHASRHPREPSKTTTIGQSRSRSRNKQNESNQHGCTRMRDDFGMPRATQSYNSRCKSLRAGALPLCLRVRHCGRLLCGPHFTGVRACSKEPTNPGTEGEVSPVGQPRPGGFPQGLKAFSLVVQLGDNCKGGLSGILFPFSADDEESTGRGETRQWSDAESLNGVLRGRRIILSEPPGR